MWKKTDIDCPDCGSKLYKAKWNSQTDMITCLHYGNNGGYCELYRTSLTRIFLGLPLIRNPKHRIAFDGRYRVVEIVKQATFSQKTDKLKKKMKSYFKPDETVLHIPTDNTGVIIERKKKAPAYQTAYLISFKGNGSRQKELWCYNADIKHLWQE